MKHLPEKFAFKLDDLGKKWIKETFGKNYDNSFLGYFNFDQKIGFNSLPLSSKIQKDHTLITTDQLFPPQTIPTITKGVKMLVWDDWKAGAIEREVMFFDGEYYVFKNISGIGYLFFKNAKPIPQLPEYTIEEAEKKFNIKIKKDE
jgi:hypothetical protein